MSARSAGTLPDARRPDGPGPEPVPMLSVHGLRVIYRAHSGERVPAVDDVTLHVAEGQVLTLLGPSGCGKTSTLRAIAGLEEVDGGSILIGGQCMYDPSSRVSVPTRRRPIGMVFQSYAIWPHMNVFDNVAFPLKVRQRSRRLSRREIENEVDRALELVQLPGFGHRGANELSGGQQQRLALARALVQRPKVLLLDEPLSNLDAKLRRRMRLELKEIQSRLGLTMVYVTHDQSEALAMSDTLVVMHDGRIVQQGHPEALYDLPASHFVADFLGWAAIAGGPVGAAADGDESATQDGTVVVQAASGPIRSRTGHQLAAGERVVVMAPPDRVRLAGTAPPGGNRIRGRVRAGGFLGGSREYLVDCSSYELRMVLDPDTSLDVGAEVELSVHPKDCVAVPHDGEDR
ncbi:MAG: ATP-binding cassette domain-containing protein [Micromonosporaceae bacterium]|nr:ATP-binding cassette domain-containing protein [Micromonosporaceae bacterium]